MRCGLFALLIACGEVAPTSTPEPTPSATPAPSPTPEPTPEPTPAEPTGRARFVGVEVPTALGDQLQLHAASALTADGVEHTLTLTRLATLATDDCDVADHAALLSAPDGPTLLSNGPCADSRLTLTGLTQDEQGALTAVSGAGGIGVLAASKGDLTPWGSYLVGQRTPGWVHELRLTSARAGTAEARRALGRLGTASALVLSDRTTVYLAGAEGGLFLFLAEQEGDLSSGALYGLRWVPRAEPGEVVADLHWVPLGAATEAEVRGWEARSPTEQEVFQVEAPGADGGCAEGFTRLTEEGAARCVRVREGQEGPAGHLFTGRAAAVAGVSLDLGALGDLTYARERQELYVALTPRAGLLGAEAEACGAVLALQLAPGVRHTGGGILASEVAATTARVLFAGRPERYTAPGLDGNRCDVERVAMPGSLTYLAGYDLLMVGERAGGHSTPAVWAWPLNGGSPTRLLTVPLCGEVGGLRWVNNLGGLGYLAVVVQHPLAHGTCRAPEGFVAPAGSDRTWAGSYGPFPTLGERAGSSDGLPEAGRGQPLERP